MRSGHVDAALAVLVPDMESELNKRGPIAEERVARLDDIYAAHERQAHGMGKLAEEDKDKCVR